MALHRHRRGSRHRAGRLSRHAVSVGHLVVSGMMFERQRRRLVPPARRISRDGDRDLQHARSADLRGLDERPRSCGRSAPSASIPARATTSGSRAGALRGCRCDDRPASRHSRTSSPSSRRRRAGWSRSRSRMCSGCEDQVERAGHGRQHPNWRRRWPVTLEELAPISGCARIAAILSRAGRGSMPAS